MTVAASYDPLYPLKGAVHVANDVLELVEIDIYQFLLCHSGKTAVFRHLQNRMMKALRMDRFALILLLGIIVMLATMEIGVRAADWLRRRRREALQRTQNEAATAAEQRRGVPNLPGNLPGISSGNQQQGQASTGSTQQQQQS